MPQGDATTLPKDQSGTGLRIGPGDLLDITVFGVPELTQRARVTNGGDIYLPLVAYVHVASLTVDEAQALLESRLQEGNYLKSPHVTVFVAEYASGVSVLGEVARPGIYPALGSRRLYDMIAAAGGLQPTAGRVVTIARRDHPGQPLSVAISNDPAASAAANIEIQQGDTIYVTKAGVVYVVGEVGHPTGLVLELNQNMTVLRAIALASGPTHNASLDQTRLIRNTPQGPVVTIVPLKKIFAAKADDVPMQADDVLFIPSSAGKAAWHGVQSALGMATGMGLRVAY